MVQFDGVVQANMIRIKIGVKTKQLEPEMPATMQIFISN